MRILFAATPEIALPSLHAIAKAHEIRGVLTNPDRRTGRGGRTSPSPVKAAAERLGLPVLQPERLDAAARGLVADLGAELLVVVAFGRIFGPKFLALFPRGGVNLHPSLLPRHRGPSPIVAAILEGDRETGVTVQRLAPEIDSGDVLGQTVLSLDGRETAIGLSERAGEEGARLLLDVCRRFDEIVPVPQDSAAATYCRLVTKEDGWIDWTESSDAIDRKVRAYAGWPHARTTWRGGELHVLESLPRGAYVAPGGVQPPGTVLGIDNEAGFLVQTGRGVLVVQVLQLPSKKPLKWKDFLNGVRDFVGSTLGGNS